MKITVCWSASFRGEKIEIRDQLIELWHVPLLDEWTEKIFKWEAPELEKQVKQESSEVKKKFDFIKMYYDFIVESDAVLICNFSKKSIKNYIWSNTFLEIGYAHVYWKKIFLLNPIPEKQEYILDELKAMDPIVLNWDLSLIKKICFT
ncbi:MAG: hypothetical protein ACD_4C00087G0003 [uncultured bacterium (gcode 4)]|uniref:Uncharacterized protein n=1 Tax=uncultured bacterium (gcode 4) TaxID=1234023 RepID=K2FYM8_9BACT|nr:MAG: hypothetical protein ACD_4C00087G0003 [uncultured bacterium (gcode 4)]